MAKKSRFWRGFTWKRFLIHTATLFGFIFIADMIFSKPEADETYLTFALKSIIKNLLISIFTTFILTLWSEPAEKEKVEE